MSASAPSSESLHLAPEHLAAYCRALAHPVRVQILKILRDRGTCISGELTLSLEKAASTVSEHLRILKEAGLVSGAIDGPRRCYCANQEALVHLQDLVRLLVSRESDCCRLESSVGLDQIADPVCLREKEPANHLQPTES